MIVFALGLYFAHQHETAASGGRAQTDRYRQVQTDTDRHTGIQTDTDRYRQTHWDTDRYRQIQTDTYGHRRIYADQYTDGHRRTHIEIRTATNGHRRTHVDTEGHRTDMGGYTYVYAC